MTKDDADIALRLLCSELGVPRPVLSWTLRAKRGRYYRGGAIDPLRRGRVAVGPRCWRGAEAALIHEIAHHVAAERGRELLVRAPSREDQRARLGLGRHKYAALYPHLRLSPRGEMHGPMFVAALKRVARAWYGDERKYPWESEYKSLRHACE